MISAATGVVASIVLLLAVPALPAQEEPPIPPDIAHWIAKLEHENGRVRRNAADELGDRGIRSVLAVPALIAALEDPLASVREEVVDALGDIGRRAGPDVAERVLPALENVLATDSDPRIRKDAIDAIEGIGKEAPLRFAGRAVRALTRAFGDPSKKVREEAIESVESVLSKSGPKWRFLRFQLERESQEQASQGRVETERAALREFEVAVRDLANALAPLYRPGFGREREELMEALGAALQVTGASHSQLLGAVAAGLSDPDEDVREDAAEALLELARRTGKDSAAQAVAGALERASSEGTLRIGHETLEVLRAVGPRAPQVATLLEKATTDTDSEVRERAAGILGDLGRSVPDGHESLEPIVSALTRTMLEDADDEVREEAAEALGSLGPKAKDAASMLRRALRDEDRGVRKAAAKALHRIDAPPEYGPQPRESST